MSDINEVIRPFGTVGLNTVSLSATSTSSNVALSKAGETGAAGSSVGGGPQQVQIRNAGPNDAFVEFGTTGGASSVAALVPNGATPGSYPVGAGATVVVSVPGLRAKFAAAICLATQTATLYFTLGSGS